MDELRSGWMVAEVAPLYRVSPKRVRAWIVKTADRTMRRPRSVVLPEALERFTQRRQVAQRPAPAVPRKPSAAPGEVIEFFKLL